MGGTLTDNCKDVALEVGIKETGAFEERPGPRWFQNLDDRHQMREKECNVSVVIRTCEYPGIWKHGFITYT